MTVYDEDFTEDDLREALDWDAQRQLKCSCGGFLDETMAVGADDNYDAEILVCHRCAAGDRAERSYRDGKGDVAGMRRRTWERTD